MYVLPSKPDMLRTGIDVRFVPEADLRPGPDKLRVTEQIL